MIRSRQAAARTWIVNGDRNEVVVEYLHCSRDKLTTSKYGSGNGQQLLPPRQGSEMPLTSALPRHMLRSMSIQNNLGIL